MYDAILVITALVIVFLGIRLVMKFRAMSSWKEEDTVVGAGGNSALPAELRELKIEEPSQDVINRLDASGESDASRKNQPPKST
jgi:hypothetical protein